jgi:hypothetical protein
MQKVTVIWLCLEKYLETDGTTSYTMTEADPDAIAKLKSLGPLIESLRAWVVVKNKSANFGCAIHISGSILGRNYATPVIIGSAVGTPGTDGVHFLGSDSDRTDLQFLTPEQVPFDPSQFQQAEPTWRGDFVWEFQEDGDVGDPVAPGYNGKDVGARKAFTAKGSAYSWAQAMGGALVPVFPFATLWQAEPPNGANLVYHTLNAQSGAVEIIEALDRSIPYAWPTQLTNPASDGDWEFEGIIYAWVFFTEKAT